MANAIHDIGGMHGFGSVKDFFEENEPVFHHEWESRVYALNINSFMKGNYTLDEFRYVQATMNPTLYVKEDYKEMGGSGYYARWLATIELTLQRLGLCTLEEIEAKIAELKEES